MAGRPYIGNAPPAVFSLFTLPVFLLPSNGRGRHRGAEAVRGRVFGMFLLARALRLRWVGALMSGLVFAFAMPLVTWLMEGRTSSAWALIPWLLLATWAVAMRSGVLPICGLAASGAALFLAGHPESSVHGFAAAAVFLVF